MEILRKPDRAYCNECKRETKHENRAEFFEKGGGVADLTPDDQETLAHLFGCSRDNFLRSKYEPYWSDRHQILQCQGCGWVSFRQVKTFEEWGRNSYYEQFPSPGLNVRNLPKWLSRLQSSELKELFQEVYLAIASDLRRLATMGARCLMDTMMTEVIGDVGNFPQKLVQLEAQGHIGNRGRDVLLAALDAGNAAAHRSFQPSFEDLSRVMDVVEHLAERLYILPEDAQQLRARTPARH